MIENVSTAISPFIARTKKAIDFYEKNIDKTDDHGLMFCIAGGENDEGDWTDGMPLPSLETSQLTYVKGFKRFNEMYFVVPDTSGTLDVGGITWTKIDLNIEDPDVWMSEYADILSQKSRWIFIDGELGSGELDTVAYKQVGLYSNLKIDTDEATDYATRELFATTEIFKTGDTEPNISYHGILEVYQNKETFISRNSELREYFTWVLEF